MARMMSVHRSGVPLAYLLNSGNGRDGLLKGEEGNSGADVPSLLICKAQHSKYEWYESFGTALWV